MADMNEVVVNQDGTVETADDGKLTTAEKAILVGTGLGVGTAGYLLGTYVFAPLFRKAKSRKAETEFERARREAKGKKKRSKRGVEYDEDADYRDVDDED